MNASASLGLEWWTPIPWILAGLAIAFAVFVFYRNRYAVAKFHDITSYGTASPPEFNEVWELNVEVLCCGADIFDPHLFLECYYRPSRTRHNWPDVLALELHPVVAAVNPIKNGQVVRYQLTDNHLKRALELNEGYFCLPSELPRRRTRLALYASGNRLIATTSSLAFRRFFKLFCKPSASFVRVGEEKGGWSHQYVQPPPNLRS